MADVENYSRPAAGNSRLMILKRSAEAESEWRDTEY